MPGVGDQAGAQPRQRVQADHLAPELVPAYRGARGRGAAAGHEREQAAQLCGGGLVLGSGRDVDGPAAIRDLASPRRVAAARYPRLVVARLAAAGSGRVFRR